MEKEIKLCDLEIYTENGLHYARIEVTHADDEYVEGEIIGGYEISESAYLEGQKVMSEGGTFDDAYHLIASVFDSKVDEWLEEYERYLAKERFDYLTSDEKMDLHNQYCESNNDYDSVIYYMGNDFFDMFFNGRPSELARAICYGEVVYSHRFITFDGNGNLQTAEHIWELVDEKELFEYYLETIK